MNTYSTILLWRQKIVHRNLIKAKIFNEKIWTQYINRNKTIREKGCRVTVQWEIIIALVCRIISEYFNNCPLSPTLSSSLFRGNHHKQCLPWILLVHLYIKTYTMSYPMYPNDSIPYILQLVFLACFVLFFG